jgi:hypothetical protein
MCLLWGTNWVFLSKKTTFPIVTAMKTSNLTRLCLRNFIYGNLIAGTRNLVLNAVNAFGHNIHVVHWCRNSEFPSHRLFKLKASDADNRKTGRKWKFMVTWSRCWYRYPVICNGYKRNVIITSNPAEKYITSHHPLCKVIFVYSWILTKLSLTGTILA